MATVPKKTEAETSKTEKSKASRLGSWVVKGIQNSLDKTANPKQGKEGSDEKEDSKKSPEMQQLEAYTKLMAQFYLFILNKAIDAYHKHQAKKEENNLGQSNNLNAQGPQQQGSWQSAQPQVPEQQGPQQQDRQVQIGGQRSGPEQQGPQQQTRPRSDAVTSLPPNMSRPLQADDQAPDSNTDDNEYEGVANLFNENEDTAPDDQAPDSNTDDNEYEGVGNLFDENEGTTPEPSNNASSFDSPSDTQVSAVPSSSEVNSAVPDSTAPTPTPAPEPTPAPSVGPSGP